MVYVWDALCVPCDERRSRNVNCIVLYFDFLLSRFRTFKNVSHKTPTFIYIKKTHWTGHVAIENLCTCSWKILNKVKNKTAQESEWKLKYFVVLLYWLFIYTEYHTSTFKTYDQPHIIKSLLNPKQIQETQCGVCNGRKTIVLWQVPSKRTLH